MINYVNQDILKSKDKLFAHGCNAQGKYASGIAGIFRREFPFAYSKYMEIYESKNLFLGTVNFAVQPNYPIVANCITQNFYGNDGKLYVNYKAVRSCLEQVLKYAADNSITSITMPKIGAGLGGGDWQIIEKIVKETNDLFPEITINIYYI